MDRPITHKNHLGQLFYLHKLPARRGKPTRYEFLKEIGDEAIYDMPAGSKILEDEKGVLTLKLADKL